MAPYAIAHMKVGLKLQETGYGFESNAPLHIVLTNALQPARALDLEERMRLEALAHEAQRANEAKEATPFTVVIGNPPYKGHSENPSKLNGKLTYAGELVQRFFMVNGEPLNERNPKWLNNDYAKFIALAMTYIERSGVGVLGYITSNSWLDGVTFRGMRWELMQAFPSLRIVDLHGNIKKRERAPDGSADEGVFAIEEGTAIALAAHGARNVSIRHLDLFGEVGDGEGHGKLAWLASNTASSGLGVAISPASPFFVMAPTLSPDRLEYESGLHVGEFFQDRLLGFQTHRDHFAISLDRETLEQRFADLAHPGLSDTEVAQRYSLKDNRDWKLRDARLSARRADAADVIAKIAYRPFDFRYGGLDPIFMDYPRKAAFERSVAYEVALNISRQQGTVGFRHVLVADAPPESCFISDRTREQGYFIPLWRYEPDGNVGPNIDERRANRFGQSAGLRYRGTAPYVAGGDGSEFWSTGCVRLDLRRAARALVPSTIRRVFED
jgi:hypothetical protein